jgi:DNA modification methylase
MAGMDGRTTHPTVKPIQLTTQLARLLLPADTGEERRILIPFAGVGSEMIGAMLAGWESITGIEITPEYIGQGNQRLTWWSQFKSYEDAADLHRVVFDEDTPEQLSFM